MTEPEKSLVEKVTEIQNKLRDGQTITDEEQRIIDKALEYLIDARMRI